MASVSYPQRKPRRLPGYDYRANGAYFVTICTKERVSWFRKNAITRIFMDTWASLPSRIEGVRLDALVVMPDHIHFVLWMTHGQTSNSSGSLGEAIRQFKAVVARRVRLAGFTAFAWQRNYYEHIIRDDDDLRRVREYIRNNPAIHETDRDDTNAKIGETERRGR
jgi:REP element-mobilizing transposase RayT